MRCCHHQVVDIVHVVGALDAFGARTRRRDFVAGETWFRRLRFATSQRATILQPQRDASLRLTTALTGSLAVALQRRHKSDKWPFAPANFVHRAPAYTRN